jgi:hypothetical protein
MPVASGAAGIGWDSATGDGTVVGDVARLLTVGGGGAIGISGVLGIVEGLKLVVAPNSAPWPNATPVAMAVTTQAKIKRITIRLRKVPWGINRFSSPSFGSDDVITTIEQAPEYQPICLNATWLHLQVNG